MIHSDFLVRFFRAQPLERAEGWLTLAISVVTCWLFAYVLAKGIDAIEEWRARRSSERRQARELQRREELGRLEAQRLADWRFARTGGPRQGYAVDREDRR